MFQRVLKDLNLFVAFLHEVKKAHPNSVQQKYPETQSPVSENSVCIWNGDLGTEVDRIPTPYIQQKVQECKKGKRRKCVIQLDFKFPQWNWLRSCLSLPPLPASYLGVRLEEQGPSLHGNFAATLAHARIKEKKGMRSIVCFHLLPLLISFQSTVLRETFAFLYCCSTL